MKCNVGASNQDARENGEMKLKFYVCYDNFIASWNSVSFQYRCNTAGIVSHLCCKYGDEHHILLSVHQRFYSIPSHFVLLCIQS